MLFHSQRQELEGSKHKLYFSGTTLLKGAVVAFVTGVRDDNKKDIIATVQYLRENQESEVVFSKSLTPVLFEKFLNEFAMKVATVSGGLEKLNDISYNFKPLSDEQFPLTDEQKDIALRAYLLKLINGGTQQEAIRSAGSHIKKFLQEA